jgi:hypothetical protein
MRIRRPTMPTPDHRVHIPPEGSGKSLARVEYVFGHDWSENFHNTVSVPGDSLAHRVNRLEERLKFAIQIGSGVFATLRLDKNRDALRDPKPGTIDALFELVDNEYKSWKRLVDV